MTPKHVNNAQVQLIADASDPNASTLINYASVIIKDYQQQLALDNKVPITLTRRCACCITRN